MGYYCTVPQCTSLAGKTKNVKFHRFPRDVTLADKWNVILKRGKPYTKYSKVCSLHFTQSDYNVTTMGQWKTLSKDAVPSQNLPRVHPDGTVMVIRKSRTIRYKDGQGKKDCESVSEKMQEKWPQTASALHTVMSSSTSTHDSSAHTTPVEDAVAYRMQSLTALANTLSQQNGGQAKPAKQDANIQTDPLDEEESQVNASYSDHSESSFHSEPNMDQYQNTNNTPITNQYQPKEMNNFETQPPPTTQPDSYEIPKDYTKNNEEYIQTETAEKYSMERKPETYQKQVTPNGYPKIQDVYQEYTRDFQEKQAEYQNRDRVYGFGWKDADSVEILRNQQHNLHILQEQHRVNENQNFFNENHIKQEIDLSNEDDKFLYERSKELESAYNTEQEQCRLLQEQRTVLEQLQHQVKTEPDPLQGCDSVMPMPGYYHSSGHLTSGAFYEQYGRQPGPELLIAKQNALAAQSQLWPNATKRPFFYSDSPHYAGSQLLHRYEDLSRILQ